MKQATTAASSKESDWAKEADARALGHIGLAAEYAIRAIDSRQE